MQNNSISELLDIAKQAARLAGDVVMDIYDKGEYESFHKEDESPVTSADYKAHDIISAYLQQHTPDIPLMSEEQTHLPLNERQHWSRYWLVDPIDGTQEFVARSGDFAVNIALIENNQPVIGVIYWPAGETLYYASQGQGAFKQSVTENKQIHVRQFENPDSDVVMIAISRRQARENVFNRMSTERVYQTLPLGSCSLKACFIAEGRADVFMRLGTTGEWDTGASECIINEAGGKITDANFNPLSYNQREVLTNPDFVVFGDQKVPWQNIVSYYPRSE